MPSSAAAPHAAPLCLPSEHLHGHWSEEPITSYQIGMASMKPRQFLRGRLNGSAHWQPHAACTVPVRGPPARVLRLLARRNASVVFSGNSVMRHLFFRFASYLRGDEHDDFSQSERAKEKALCAKELDPDVGGVAGKFKKPFCRSGCCGVCSCAHRISSPGGTHVALYFIWQQEWYDARMRRVWDSLLASPPFEGRRTYLIMNAGLVNARVASLSCILHYQFPLLRDYLLHGMPGANSTATPPPVAAPPSLQPSSRVERWRPQADGVVGQPLGRVRTMYLSSPPTQHEEATAWMGAQDGMLRALFEAMPASHRPVWLDTTEVLRGWGDFIDVNHFGGASANALVEAVVHLVLHWEALYSDGGRGAVYERRATRRLNRFDVGPSSDMWLHGVHSKMDTSVSPPPAHSLMENCL